MAKLLDTGIWLFRPRLFVAHNSYESVTMLPRPPSRLGMGGIWAVDSQENH